jgi:hypothetical protein
VVPVWIEEVCNFFKTSLQEIRGAALTDSTMSKAEARQLETLLKETTHSVLFI